MPDETQEREAVKWLRRTVKEKLDIRIERWVSMTTKDAAFILAHIDRLTRELQEARERERKAYVAGRLSPIAGPTKLEDMQQEAERDARLAYPDLPDQLAALASPPAIVAPPPA